MQCLGNAHPITSVPLPVRSVLSGAVPFPILAQLSSASAVPIWSMPSSASAGSVRVHAFPPQPWSNPRWSSPRRCRAPRCDAIPQPIFPHRRSSAASPFAPLPCRFLAVQHIPLLFLCLAVPCYSVAVPFCSVPGPAMPSRFGSAPCRRMEGEDYSSSRSSSTSYRKRPFPLFLHCPKPRS